MSRSEVSYIQVHLLCLLCSLSVLFTCLFMSSIRVPQCRPPFYFVTLHYLLFLPLWSNLSVPSGDSSVNLIQHLLPFFRVYFEVPLSEVRLFYRSHFQDTTITGTERIPCRSSRTDLTLPVPPLRTFLSTHRLVLTGLSSLNLKYVTIPVGTWQNSYH